MSVHFVSFSYPFPLVSAVPFSPVRSSLLSSPFDQRQRTSTSYLSLRRRPYVCSLFSVLACFTFHCIRSSFEFSFRSDGVVAKYMRARASLAYEKRGSLDAIVLVFVLGPYRVYIVTITL